MLSFAQIVLSIEFHMTRPNFLPLLILLIGIVSLFLPSCRLLNPSIMLKTDKTYAFDTLSVDSSSTFSRQYRLAANDIIEFRLFANDGFRMIDLISMTNGSNQSAAIARQGFDYQLDFEGTVRLPIIGTTSLKGMTVREAELFLEQRYAEYYVKPFAIIRVTNRRVIVFPGNPGDAQVIMLTNNNTTLMEALAQAGGISENGKAHKVKLIRQTANPGDPKVYKIDLSNMTNIAQANIVVQANDVIYVEPRRQIASRTLREISPIISLASSILTIYLLTLRVQ
jgi:polysaccharide export outer membrane protein